VSGPPISPDGRWWWDGRQWQTLLSPDGTQRWDGKQWVPAWLPPESATALHGPPEFAASPSAPAEPVPAWTGQPRKARPWVIWGALAVGAALILVTFLSVRDILPPLPALPSFGSSPPPRVPARAAPDLSLTQHQRADKLLNLQLAPALAGAAQSEQVLAADCGSGHQQEQACRAAIADTYHKLSGVVDQIDRSDVPPCIAKPLQDFRNRINLAANALALAIRYFDAKDGTRQGKALDDFASDIQGTAPLDQAVQTAYAACPG